MDNTHEFQDELTVENHAGLWIADIVFTAEYEWKVEDASQYCECGGRRGCHRCHAVDVVMIDCSVTDLKFTGAWLAPRLPDGTISDERVVVPVSAMEHMTADFLTAAHEYAEDQSEKAEPKPEDFDDHDYYDEHLDRYHYFSE